MNYFYVQLNKDKFAEGITQSETQLVKVDSYDTSLLGRKYNEATNTFYKLPQITADKTQIKADGIDAATISVHVDDATYNGTVKILFNGSSAFDLGLAEGKASFKYNSNDIGQDTITVKTEQWGDSSIIINVEEVTV